MSIANSKTVAFFSVLWYDLSSVFGSEDTRVTRDQQFFLQLLRDYLNGVSSAPAEGLDESQLVAWADAHELGGIVFVQYGPCFRDSALRKRIRVEFGSAVSHASNLRADYDELCAALRAVKVPFVPIKGVLISACYPNPELRTMGDVDLLVRPADAARIKSALEPLGFQNLKWADTEWHYKKRNSLFELQAEMMDDETPDIGQVNPYFNDFWPRAKSEDGSEYRLDPNFHFLYLIAHIAKHLRWIGVGFRQFYDLAMLMRRGNDPYDWDWIKRQAEEIGFFRFTECCLALIERWFGVLSPYGVDCLSDELFEAVTEKVFLDGVFGFENEQNDIHAVEKQLRSSDSALGAARLRAAGKLAFPPYRELIVSEKYSYLRGRPYLLPYAWIKRALHGRGSKNASELNAVLHASRDRVEERARHLRELGLSGK